MNLRPASGDADDAKALDYLEVAAVVRADGEIMPQAGRGDEKVEIADQPPALTELASFATEEVAHVVVEA